MTVNGTVGLGDLVLAQLRVGLKNFRKELWVGLLKISNKLALEVGIVCLNRPAHGGLEGRIHIKAVEKTINTPSAGGSDNGLDRGQRPGVSKTRCRSGQSHPRALQIL